MAKEKFNITTLTNNDGCFDLQFRKDTRRERTNAPTYYRWKIQFVITTPKESVNILQKAKIALGCGNISLAKGQARFSIQKIDDMVETVIPFFNKNKLTGNKKNNFDLWQKAVAIIYNNKGVYLAKWKKSDLLCLIEIYKSMAKHKSKPRSGKWMDMAKIATKNPVN